MPRGRHRHSPPLHRLLPPSTIAGASLVCAAGAWLFAEPVVLRALAGATAAVAVVGSVVMRRWDRLAGKRVAELTRARTSDEWRYEERTAELESDLDESRELRIRLEHRLREKRAELAALRSEHAALLRRYATAETERASALEGRRLLAIEAAAPARALPAAPAATEPVSTDPGATEPESGEPVSTAPVPGEPVSTAPSPSVSPSLYARANSALDRLAREAGSAEAGTATSAASAAAGSPAAAAEHDAAGECESRGKSMAADEHTRAAAIPTGHYLVPTAAAVVPPTPTRRPPVEGSFDFFGTKRTAPAALEAVQNEDLADVVGEEALVLNKAEAEAEFKPLADTEQAVGQVIDLTEHDETEQIDVAELRSALQA